MNTINNVDNVENVENVENTDKLQRIKEIIEGMNKSYQLEILKLFVNASAQFSENNNGVFINLTELDSVIISKLENYIDFVYQQQTQLDTIETQKDNIKDEFFTLDKKKNNKLKQTKEENCIISDEK